MTHYAILEVSEQASLQVIEAAWKVLLKRFHTDGFEPNEEKARLVNQAHDILENPEQRRRYDLNLAQERAAQARQLQQQQFDPAEWLNVPQSAYPAASPPNILQMAAQRVGTNFLAHVFQQVPELQFIVQSAMKRGGRA